MIAVGKPYFVEVPSSGHGLDRLSVSPESWSSFPLISFSGPGYRGFGISFMAGKKENMWKSLVGFLGIVAVLSIIAAAFLIRWKHPRIASAMESVVSQGITEGTVCEIGGGSLSFLGGFEAHEVRISAPVDGGGIVEINASSMKLKPRFGAIAGDLKGVRRVLKNPSVLRTDQREVDVLVGKWVKNATLSDAQIRYHGGVHGPITVSNAKIRVRPVEGPDANIEVYMDADSLRASKVLSESIVLRVRRAWPRVELEVEGNAYSGKFHARFAGDFERSDIESGMVEIEEVDFGELHKEFGEAGRIVRGELDAEIELNPGSWDFKQWSGAGRFGLKNACFEELSILNSVVTLIAVPQLRRLEFEEIGGKFKVEDGVFVSEKITGRGKPIAVTVSGRIGADGYLDCSIEGRFEKMYQDSLDAFVWGAMNPGKDDCRTFRCRLSGPHNRVRVELDRSHQKRAVQTILNSLQKEFGSFFRR